MTVQEKCDLSMHVTALIEVTEWAGLTVYLNEVYNFW